MPVTSNTIHPADLPDKLKKTVRKWLVLSFNRAAYLTTEDRRILEKVILPNLSVRKELSSVLSVGCAWYTEGYERFFRGRSRAYWTIDIDPNTARFGASGGRHIIGSAAEVANHFSPGSLDFVLCNGVLGWGLDDREQVARAFNGFFNVLRPGGLFLLGWNDVPDHRPFEPVEVVKESGFISYTFDPLNGSHFLTNTENRHTFDFFIKAEASTSL